VLGQTLGWPVLIAPAGMSRLYHRAGETAVARAAARAGTVYALSTYSSETLEAVARATTGPKVFQLFINPGWADSLALVDRAQAAGYEALCLTVDTTAAPNKERDYRSGFITGRPSLRSVVSIVAHPRWALGVARGGVPRLANLGVGPLGALERQWRDAHLLSWEHVDAIRNRWARPLALKGLFAVGDAERAAAIGVDALIVSNHGGRQLDAAVAPLDLVALLARAVGSRVEILVDSGIRRGTDVLKALALGARACLIGRAYLYGLAAGGEAGVTRALDILREELVRDMTLLGTPDLASLDTRVLRAEAWPAGGGLG
jgi:L-lactate dehydrogenase (cytochrome)